MEWFESLRTNWRGFSGILKISLRKPTFTPLPKIALWAKKMLLGWASRKTREVWALKSQEVGEQNWVYYGLGGFGEDFVRGAIQKVRWKRPPPTLPARHATQTHFFFNPTAEIRIPGSYLVFPLLEQIYSLCSGGWMGSQNCVLVAGRATTQARTPTFTLLPKIAFWS